MGNLRLFYSQRLENIYRSSVKRLFELRKTFLLLLNTFMKSKYFNLIKDGAFFLFIFLCPVLAMFIGDYIRDDSILTERQQTLEASLRSTLEQHRQVLEDIQKKILVETLQNNPEGLQKLFATLRILNTYAHEFPSSEIKGLLWITSDFKAIGVYGVLSNFNMDVFFPLLRVLEKTPNNLYLFKEGENLYLGTGVWIKDKISGYLLLPFSLKNLESQYGFPLTTLFTPSLSFNLSHWFVALNDIYKKPSLLLQFQKKIKWFHYFYRNILNYMVFLMLASMILFLKKRTEAKERFKLAESEKKFCSLNHNFMTRQKTANLIINNFQDIAGSIKEISRVLIEDKKTPSSHLLDEKSQLNLFRKIYESFSLIEEGILKTRNVENIDIREIVQNILSFFVYKIEEERINVKIDYHINDFFFETDKDAFYQLLLSLLSSALERTPEQGTILMSINAPPEGAEGILTVNIEDNGYSFTEEQIKKFKIPSKIAKNKNYFELDWESIHVLAQSLNCFVSVEKLSSAGNRIIIQVKEPLLSDETSYSGDNIIKLFPPP